MERMGQRGAAALLAAAWLVGWAPGALAGGAQAPARVADARPCEALAASHRAALTNLEAALAALDATLAAGDAQARRSAGEQARAAITRAQADLREAARQLERMRERRGRWWDD